MPHSDSIIFVKNTNDFYHEDRFDGEDYSFPPGEKTQIPIDAARHMFGYGLKDKSETLVRLGWAMRLNKETKRFEEDPTGVQRLSRFVFTRAVMVEEVVGAAEETASDDGLEIA
jgi:hypothetical protein